MKQQEAFDILNSQLSDVSKSQIRSMSLEVLPRLINTLHENSNNCPSCKKHEQQGDNYVNDIRPLFEQDIRFIKEFERWVDSSKKHLKATHKQHPRGQISSTYTTIGMAIGTFIAFLISYFINNNNILGGLSIGWAIGMLFGYSIGKLKEKKLGQLNKLY
ncbi:hypothetical protein [Carboxylicivirga marina]|uniref:Glycine zipper family protein n=1 Tax=Carboxylicivirga marina TaxID=2800988 RepID=A0ABS1HLF1_9BACT|nr:hypothetical protein [Carboxylicivirga marina]MBK3518377.1 hypothetical protein [Carboxylicivirga marina]